MTQRPLRKAGVLMICEYSSLVAGEREGVESPTPRMELY